MHLFLAKQGSPQLVSQKRKASHIGLVKRWEALCMCVADGWNLGFAGGQMVLDGSAVAYKQIAVAIEEIPGVVAHGLVEHPKVTAIVATSSGPQILRQVREPAIRWSPCHYLHPLSGIA